jgi:hypothetical protein
MPHIRQVINPLLVPVVSINMVKTHALLENINQ